MKISRLILALVIYGAFWGIGYMFFLENDPFGIGSYVFALVFLLLQFILFVVMTILIYVQNSFHFSIGSFLALFFEATSLYFMLAYPKTFDDVYERYAITLIFVILFVVQLYFVFFREKRAI